MNWPGSPYSTPAEAAEAVRVDIPTLAGAMVAVTTADLAKLSGIPFLIPQDGSCPAADLPQGSPGKCDGASALSCEWISAGRRRELTVHAKLFKVYAARNGSSICVPVRGTVRLSTTGHGRQEGGGECRAGVTARAAQDSSRPDASMKRAVRRVVKKAESASDQQTPQEHRAHSPAETRGGPPRTARVVACHVAAMP